MNNSSKSFLSQKGKRPKSTWGLTYFYEITAFILTDL